MFVVASLTDPIVEFATNVVADLGLPGVFILMLLESACIPIPSEATMLFAGFNVSEGEYSLIAVTLVGSVANLVGSWVAYGVGYYGRVDLIEKHGHKVFIKPHHLVVADRWFERHGDATVFFTRMLPIVRTFISLPAGVARMPFIRFSVLTFLGCLPWVFMLTFIGQQVGENWVGLEGLAALLRLLRRGVHRRRRRLPVREVAPRRRRRRRRRTGRAGGRCPRPMPALTTRACARATRSRSACCTGRPSCCRSPPRATSRSSRGCAAGPTAASTASCARPSRSRCTPARRRRCSSACATRSARRRARWTAGACSSSS